MVVTEVSEDNEVLFIIVVLDSSARSCWLQLLTLLVIVPAGYWNFC